MTTPDHALALEDAKRIRMTDPSGEGMFDNLAAAYLDLRKKAQESVNAMRCTADFDDPQETINADAELRRILGETE